MGYKDWDEDLLNFDYSHPVPEERPTIKEEPRLTMQNSIEEMDAAIKREEERARQLQAEYERIRAESRAERTQVGDRIRNAAGSISELTWKEPQPEEIPRPMQPTTQADYERNAAAQEEAYRRYRQEYASKTPSGNSQNSGIKVSSSKPVKSSRTGRSKRAAAAVNNASRFYKFTRFLSIPYLLTAIAFVGSMTLMNILPFFWWVFLIVVIGLLSVIIVTQLRKFNVKKWAKVLATFMSTILIIVFGFGSAYALGTLSFLDKTTVQNEDKVDHITKEPFNVLMTGIDVYGKIKTQGRSDVNMLVTVNPETETILLTSVPRDYEVRLPDFNYATDKLTHSGFYGVDVTIHAMEDLLNTDVNYYVRVNFSTVYIFIDALGGLDVKSDYTFRPVKMPEWEVQEGWNHMDGKQALAFARERKSFNEGDRQRVKNQQLVFEAMLNKATSSRAVLMSYNKVLSKTEKYFEMSISSSEIRSLVKLQLAKNPDWKIYKNALTGGDASKGTYTTGGVECYVMSQDPTCVANAQRLITAVMNGEALEKDADGNVTVAPVTTTEDAE